MFVMVFKVYLNYLGLLIQLGTQMRQVAYQVLGLLGQVWASHDHRGPEGPLHPSGYPWEVPEGP